MSRASAAALRILVVGCTSILASLTVIEAAVTVELNAVKDACIYEEDEKKANGAGEYLFAGNSNSSQTRRALIQFDFASIPPGSTITSVTLTLYMSRTQGGTENITLHRTINAWTEGPTNPGGEEGGGDGAQNNDVTWRYRSYNKDNEPASLQWTTLGGDHVAGVSATTPVGNNGFYSWTSAGMVTDVQSWLGVPATNHGWFVRGDEGSSATAKRFGSRTNPDAGGMRRPKLTVVYNPPAITGACCHPTSDTCTQETADDCANVVGGTFQGTGAPCTPGLCVQPTGACCAPLGDCTVATQFQCESGGGAYQGDSQICAAVVCPIILEPFVDPLPIPYPARPVSGVSGGAASYHIVMQEVQQQMHRDLPAVTVWGYGDDPNTVSASFPGPTLEARSEQGIFVRYFNDLRDTSQPGDPLRTMHYLNVDHCAHGAEDHSARAVVHLHGGHVPPASDGYPETTALPGQELKQCVNDPTRRCQADVECTGPGTCDGDSAACATDADCAGHGGAQDCRLCVGGVYYPNAQDASTLWFHDHALGITRLNVYMGMAAFYIIRDGFEDALGLPGPPPRRGEPVGTRHYELPLAIQDRAFKGNATNGFSLSYPDMLHDHFFGDTYLVNGKVWPSLDVDSGKYRFRILNGTNGRRMTIGLDRLGSGGMQDLPFHVIGTEGGLLPAPVTLSAITLGPAERADVIVDFACADPPACTTPLPVGTEVVLRDSDVSTMPIPDIMKFVVGATPGFTAPIPAVLRPFQPLDPTAAVRTRQFLLRKSSDPCSGQKWVIRSKSSSGADIGELFDDVTEFPQLGTTEIWEFANPSVEPHPMHLHLEYFQILNRQDFQLVDNQIMPIGSPVPPGPIETGWKDTARTEPGQILRIIVRFTDYPGKYPYHCHILEHEDHEMMRQFQTTVGAMLQVSPSLLSWSAPAGATGYDVVQGLISTLWTTGGDFTAATQGCLVNGLLTTSVPIVPVPPAGEIYWYLTRTRDAAGVGTYDSGSSSQAGLRDAEIAASISACF